jgi:ketosteroid isomerase-like protein
MTYPTALAAIEALVQARDAGDVAVALGCYTDNPTLVAQPGVVVTGQAAARSVLEGFIALKAQFTVTARQILETDGTALHYSSWTLRGADGFGIAFAGISTDVLERQSDGGWLLSIDNPYGVGTLD